MTILDINECSICFHPIKKISNTYNPNFNLDLACKKCDDVFSPQEKETITHAFNIARGIFDVDEKDVIAVKDMLYDVQTELKLQNKRSFTTQSIFQKILIRSQVYRLRLNYFFQINYHYSKNPSNNSNYSICCKITNEDLEYKDNIPKNEGVCQDCIQKYSKEEILTMISLFEKYGGFFNQFNIEKPALGKIIEKLLDSLTNEGDFSRMLEFNEQALYQSLLHGYTPRAFIDELKKL